MEETGSDGSEREENVVVRADAHEVSQSTKERGVSKNIAIHCYSATRKSCLLTILRASCAHYLPFPRG